MTLEEEIKKEIQGLTKQQQQLFGWRCAVRALPFVGYKGDFSFWKDVNILESVYIVFDTIDLALNYNNFIKTIHLPPRAAYTAIHASNCKAFPAAFAIYTANSAAQFVSFSNMKMTFGFSKTKIDLANLSFILETTKLLLDTAASCELDFSSIILQDLRNVKENELPTISKADYGEVWTNFLSALKKEDLGYWSNLYENLIQNNFKLDLAELERRYNVPNEIKLQGAKAVGYYLEELEEGSKNLNEARIIILGDKGSGKTSIARRLENPNAPMTDSSESTAGVDTTLWKLKEEEMNVRIWDFAGHTVTHAVHQFFLSERSLYIMVYDGRTEERNRLEYWLDHMKNYGGDSKAFILVNERDEHTCNIPINYLKEQYPIAGFYSFNIEKDKNELLEFRKVVANYIKNNPSWENQEIPTSYYLVKKELEKLFDRKKGKEYIEKSDFIAIAKKYDAVDSERLLKNLHHLGISLWYENMDKYDTLVLNPEWISQGVYQIINWINNEKVHSLSLDCFSKVFKEVKGRFPKDKHKFLFNLMKHYELAYETDDDKKRLIIPHLLNEDQPVELPVFSISDSLMLKYEADQPLPTHTISRFIVRHNQQIKSDGSDALVWRYGVILENGKGSVAMVREKGRSIEVSVKGNSKTEFTSDLRDTLNNIFNSYVSKKPKLKYRVVGYGEIPNQLLTKNDLWLSERIIASHATLDRLFFDAEEIQEISLKETAEKFNITYNIINVRDNDTVILGGKEHQVIKNTFNFKDCNLELQGSLNLLAEKLQKKGETEEAEELIEAAQILDEIKDDATKEEVKKKGLHKRLGGIVKDLGDKDSTLYKVVEGMKKGKNMAQDIAKEYNKLAQWLALPQVPTPFLKKEDKKG